MDEAEQVIAHNLSKSTYERTDLKNVTVSAENLAKRCTLDNGRHGFRDILETLGALNKLPLEILQMIFLVIGLRSLTTLLSVNRCARLYVDNLSSVSGGCHATREGGC